MVDITVLTSTQAIEHFSSNIDDRVDIINLSFGFSRFAEQLKPIRNAIHAARDNNVIVLAASGNEGGNTGVFWPAKLYEVGDVIRVSASDCDGNASGFNPTIGSERRLCTLGEAVPSCQYHGSPKQRIYSTGTSFATPIMAATAAAVLGFVHHAGVPALTPDGKPDSEGLRLPDDFEDLKARLHTRLGMEKVLCQTCVQQGEEKRGGFSYITPWYFLEIDEQLRIGMICNILRGLP